MQLAHRTHHTYRYGTLFWSACVVVLLLFQLVVHHHLRDARPPLPIVTPPPTQAALDWQSMGDSHFLYWLYVLQLQSSGDSYGRFTALYQYDYALLQDWFYRMDALDWRPNYVPLIASYYYGNTQNLPDTRYIAEYLVDHYHHAPASKKWWWMAQAIYIANHRLEDKEWALKLANELHDNPYPDMPLWARQLPAFILRDMGEDAASLALIEQMLQSYEQGEIGEGEINFMKYFIQERLDAMKAEAMGK